jgi:hypothetical protein
MKVIFFHLFLIIFQVAYAQTLGNLQDIDQIRKNYNIESGHKKCEKLLFNKEDKINYQETFQEYQKIRNEFFKKSKMMELELKVKNEMPEPYTEFNLQNDPDLIMRMKWAIETYKTHKGKVLPVVDRYDQNANVFTIENNKKTNSFNFNLPKYYKMCKFLDDTNHRLENKLQKAQGPNAKCLEWIENNDWLQGEKPGWGPLAPMKIRFDDQNEKLKFDGMTSNYTSNENSEEVVITKGDRFTNGNKLKLTRDSDKRLKNMSVQYKNSKGETIKSEVEFIYINNQCVPNIVKEKDKIAPSLEDCSNEDFHIRYTEQGELILLNITQQNYLFEKYFKSGQLLTEPVYINGEFKNFASDLELESYLKNYLEKKFYDKIEERMKTEKENFWKLKLTELRKFCERYDVHDLHFYQKHKDQMNLPPNSSISGPQSLKNE